MIDNDTGNKYVMEFTAMDFHLSVKPYDGNPPTLKQASMQLDIWNRAQRNYKNEFTYSLENN
jgi:hypothetical protein